ncbi:endonuclease/exonuclease/phosphatase family protein [Candidatus Vecturithrix granuli]|uniref:Endonuclease/exonuclease/phosphatase family protein n=1 Tax=Vecturithrix granuli TaxID=1499967 RepID=A0A081C3N8_VECG1|nr:endonuclease/exonuclease/phosphatase family protein [Candidatus Vecturithrix granuli]
MRRILKYGLWMGLLIFVICVAGIGLFVVNGVWLAHNEIPLSGQTSQAAANQTPFEGATITIMSYNIAKGFIHQGGISFAAQEVVLKRLHQIADLINAEQPDLVFLSETIFECGPSSVNQITTLAEATDMPFWAFGENYNFGLPFYRIVGGNAILSRWPLETVANPSLVGRKPFYVTQNNRRILWCKMTIKGEDILLGSVHNDSYNLQNNLVQVQQILGYLKGRPAILAGDFNAQPHEAPMQLFRETGQFVWAFNGPLTFPSSKPQQKIDFILAPAAWEFLDHRVLQSTASDHLPIISTFRVTE